MKRLLRSSLFLLLLAGGGLSCLLGCSGGSSKSGFVYDVPVLQSSPWPMMRRTRLNDGLSPIKPQGRGGELWRFPTAKGIFSVPVIGEEGVVLVGSADKNFYAINPDGTMRWIFETGEIIDSAASVGSDGTIYFGSGDGNVYALDNGGKEKWRFAAHHSQGSPDAGSGGRCSDLPPQGGFSTWFEGNVIIGPQGQLYAGNDDFRLYALNAKGKELFSFYAGPIPFGVVWSAVTTRLDGSAVFGSMDFFVYSITQAGECQWRKFLGAPVSATPAQSKDGTIYIGSWDGKMYALDGLTGAIKWTYQTREHVYGSAAIGPDGTVYFGSTDGTFYALNGDGSLKWSYDVFDPIRSSPAVAGDGSVFFGAGNGIIYSLKEDGSLNWSYDTTSQDRNDLNSSPVLGTESLYIGSEDGGLYGIPYGYCSGEGDSRCSTVPLGEGIWYGSELYYVTPGGRSQVTIEEPVKRGSALSFRLLVLERGRMVGTGIDPQSFEASFNPSIPFEVAEQAGGEWMNIVPDQMMSPGRAYTVELEGKYRTDSGAEGSVSKTYSFTTVSENIQAPVMEPGENSAYALELKNLSPYQPPVIVSLNQIGFDSVDFLGSVIHKQGNRFVLWLVSGKAGGGGTVIDPETPSMVAMNGILDGASFLMDGSGLTLITGGPPIKLSSFRIASQFDATGKFDSGTSVFAQASCSNLGAVGLFLDLFQLCNTQGNFVSVGTIRGMPYSGAANQRPQNVRLSSLGILSGGRQVRATFEADDYPLSEHLPAIVIIDSESGEALEMDYLASLTSTADADGNIASTILSLPDGVTIESGSGKIAVVVTDLFPLAEVEL